MTTTTDSKEPTRRPRPFCNKFPRCAGWHCHNCRLAEIKTAEFDETIMSTTAWRPYPEYKDEPL